MTERDLVVGSASPPTADVPTSGQMRAPGSTQPSRPSALPPAPPATGGGGGVPARLRNLADELVASAGDAVLVANYYGADRDVWHRLNLSADRLHDYLADADADAGADYRHHSGVAGEPEATTKEASEIDSPAGPTQLPVPTPDSPAVADVAGGVVVSDEMVEAFKSAIPEERHGWLPYDNELRPALGAVLEHYLRQMARDAALRAAATDALRVVYWQLRERTSAFRTAGGNQSYALGLEEATAAVEERLDELERGTGRG